MSNVKPIPEGFPPRPQPRRRRRRRGDRLLRARVRRRGAARLEAGGMLVHAALRIGERAGHAVRRDARPRLRGAVRRRVAGVHHPLRRGRRRAARAGARGGRDPDQPDRRTTSTATAPAPCATLFGHRWAIATHVEDVPEGGAAAAHGRSSRREGRGGLRDHGLGAGALRRAGRRPAADPRDRAQGLRRRARGLRASPSCWLRRARVRRERAGDGDARRPRGHVRAPARRTWERRPVGLRRPRLGHRRARRAARRRHGIDARDDRAATTSSARSAAPWRSRPDRTGAGPRAARRCR